MQQAIVALTRILGNPRIKRGTPSDFSFLGFLGVEGRGSSIAQGIV